MPREGARPSPGSGRRVSFPAMHARDLDPAFEIAARHVESGDLPFAIVSVANRDGVIREVASGSPNGQRIGTNAACLLASITKPIVATAVMCLAHQGRFSLTAPIARWLPELDAAGIRPFTAW